MDKTKDIKGPNGHHLVVVDWLDTCSPGRSWQAPEFCDDYPPLRCQSVGWLGKKEKSHLVLYTAHTFKKDGSIGDVTSIPMGCVKRIRRLK